jgi:hypothetical protein
MTLLSGMQISQLMFIAALSFGVGNPISQPTPAMTGDYLLVQNEDPVELDGYIDATGSLQVAHDTDSLADYDQTLHAEHDTHTTITIRIYDFSTGGTTWQIDASHGGPTGPVDWSRGTNYAYYTFGTTNGELEVDIEATAQGEIPKTQKIFIKTKSRIPL